MIKAVCCNRFVGDEGVSRGDLCARFLKGQREER